jgi:hypothetical protein
MTGCTAKRRAVVPAANLASSGIARASTVSSTSRRVHAKSSTTTAAWSRTLVRRNPRGSSPHTA